VSSDKIARSDHCRCVSTPRLVYALHERGLPRSLRNTNHPTFVEERSPNLYTGTLEEQTALWDHGGAPRDRDRRQTCLIPASLFQLLCYRQGSHLSSIPRHREGLPFCLGISQTLCQCQLSCPFRDEDVPWFLLHARELDHT